MLHKIIKEGENYFKISEDGIKKLPISQVPLPIIKKYELQKIKQEQLPRKMLKRKRYEKNIARQQQRKKVSMKRKPRKIIERNINRKLLAIECVHHLDCNVGNNCPENLLITNNSEHMKLHWQLKRLVKQDLQGKKIVFDLDKRVYKVLKNQIKN